MNPLTNEGDAFRVLLLVILGGLGVAAAGLVGDGWMALSVVLTLVVGIGLGWWVARQRRDTKVGVEPASLLNTVVRPSILVVAPVEFAGPALAREVAGEGVASVRIVLLAAEQEHARQVGRATAELRVLLQELGIAAQVTLSGFEDALEAVRSELRDDAPSHVFVATHRREHPAFAVEEDLVHAIDGVSETPVVAVAFAAP